MEMPSKYRRPPMLSHEERCVIAHAALQLFKEVAAIHNGDADMAVVACTIRYCNLMGTAASISDLAEAAAMPRITVMRKLQKAEERGLVRWRKEGKRKIYYIPSDVVHGGEWKRVAEKVYHIFIEAGGALIELSKKNSSD